MTSFCAHARVAKQNEAQPLLALTTVELEAAPAAVAVSLRLSRPGRHLVVGIPTGALDVHLGQRGVHHRREEAVTDTNQRREAPKLSSCSTENQNNKHRGEKL